MIPIAKGDRVLVQGWIGLPCRPLDKNGSLSDSASQIHRRGLVTSLHQTGAHVLIDGHHTPTFFPAGMIRKIPELLPSPSNR